MPRGGSVQTASTSTSSFAVACRPPSAPFGSGKIVATEQPPPPPGPMAPGETVTSKGSSSGVVMWTPRAHEAAGLGDKMVALAPLAAKAAEPLLAPRLPLMEATPGGLTADADIPADAVGRKRGDSTGATMNEALPAPQGEPPGGLAEAEAEAAIPPELTALSKGSWGEAVPD
mmetsp:Transcript_68557/g.149790  ORF Transcript_68557/g.149790 Transcript_68557/m.149790 type:complete len:173 (+) Transcript_68557:59-577(+)